MLSKINHLAPDDPKLLDDLNKINRELNVAIKKASVKNYTPYIKIPLTPLNFTSFCILLSLILLGTYYLFKIIMRKRCLCALCSGEYKVVSRITKGGFGEVVK